MATDFGVFHYDGYTVNEVPFGDQFSNTNVKSIGVWDCDTAIVYTVDDISILKNSAWSVLLKWEEPVPGKYTQIPRTSDGTMWISTRVGLFKYDGSSFVLVEHGLGQIGNFAADSDGHLWVVQRKAGISIVMIRVKIPFSFSWIAEVFFVL